MFLTLIIAFFSLIVLMIVHEFGHFIIAKKFGVKVEEFGIGYPPRIYGKKFGDTLYSINWVPLGAFVKIYGEAGDVHSAESFTDLAMYKRMLIVLGGVLAFWVAAIIIFSVLFGIGASVPVGDQNLGAATPVQVVITAIENNTPAQTAGLKTGDILLSAKNATSSMVISKIADFQNFIKTDNGRPVTLTLDRGGKQMDVTLSPRINYPANEGSLGIGLERMATIISKYPWYQAPVQGVIFTWQVTIKSLQGIWGVVANLFSGRGVPSGAELAGPVGITIFLANAATYGPGFFLYFIGSIAVLVAIFNLFPIPALDGGKLLFLIIEWVARKPVPVKWEQNITIVFFILLISMSLFITVRFDIPRLVNYVSASFSK